MNKILTTVTALLVMAIAASAQENKHYEIKSGILKQTTEVMGRKTESVSYFDDFGALQASRSKVEIPGSAPMDVATIQKEGKMFMVNYTSGQVQEIPMQESVNYLDLTDEIVDKYKIVKAGEEEILGRMCAKYSEEVSQMGQTAKVTVWVWKGIPIKNVTEIQGMSITTEVTEIVEDAMVLPQVFDIPE